MDGHTEIRSITPTQAMPIRHKVLRPHQSFEACRFPIDDEETTFHIGAFVDHQLVTIATIAKQDETRFDEFQQHVQYRLRGMATLPDFQGRGLGRAVIRHSLEQVWANGGTLLWCNARLIAVDFYQKLGFATIGTEFTIPEIGPHLVMFVEQPPAV